MYIIKKKEVSIIATKNKSDTIQDFISKYKRLEELCFNDNLNGVRGFEESLSDTDFRTDRLRIIRQIRNFITHHEQPFVSVNSEMCEFLDECIKEFENKKLKCKDLAKRVTVPTLSDNIMTCVDFILKKKFDYIPVTDKSGELMFILDKNALFKFISDSNKLTTKLNKLSDVKKPSGVLIVNENDYGDSVPAHVTAVVVKVDKNKIIYKGMYIN